MIVWEFRLWCWKTRGCDVRLFRPVSTEGAGECSYLPEAADVAFNVAGNAFVWVMVRMCQLRLRLGVSIAMIAR